MTQTLRLSELYTSIQGEGPNVGRPVQFVRFAGCNMRCPAWPCDTQHAIDPKIYLQEGESEKLNPFELRGKLSDWPRALVLTGGEPFVQPDTLLREFCQDAYSDGYTIECFTNGTACVFPQWAMRMMKFVLDFKLFGSGEQVVNERHQTRMNNVRQLRRYDTIKFTVKNEDDLQEAADIHSALSLHTIANFTVGRVWGSELTDADVAEFVLQHELPWTLNVQLHNHIWSAQERKR